MLYNTERQARQTRHGNRDYSVHYLVSLAHERGLIATRGTFYFLPMRKQQSILQQMEPIADRNLATPLIQVA